MKITKRLPPADQPRLLDAAQIVAKDEAVAALIAAAPTTPQAWESFGPRRKDAAELARDAEVEAIHAALAERRGRIRQGRALVEKNGLQPGYAERFAELHLERLELRWKLDALTFADAEPNLARLAERADQEVSDALGDQWPNASVQAALLKVSQAVAWEVGVETACRLAVRAAVSQRYRGADNTTEEAS